MNTMVAPAEPNAMPSSEESTIIIFLHGLLHRVGMAVHGPARNNPVASRFRI
jgi:hypothetical protein